MTPASAVEPPVRGVPTPVPGEPSWLPAEARCSCVVGGDLLAGSRSPVVQLGEVHRAHAPRALGRLRYPAGLVGEDIPLAGRICAICDVYDALVTARPYKPAWAVEDALDEIGALTGSQFDPRPVELFLALAAAEIAAAEMVHPAYL